MDPTEYPELHVVLLQQVLWCCVQQKKSCSFYIQRTPTPMEKKKRGKKKGRQKDVPSTGIELANFDFIV